MGRPVLIRIGLCILLLLSLFLLSQATENSERFDHLYGTLLAVNVVALIVLVGLIGANLWRLVQQYRTGWAGSRLMARLLAVLVALTLVPVVIVFLFSVQFLRSDIDSWFDVRVENALEDALTLSQASLDIRMREVLGRMRAISEELTYLPDTSMVLALSNFRESIDANELALLTSNGRVIAASGKQPSRILPSTPEPALLMQLRQGRPYVGLNPEESGEMQIRVLVPVLDPLNPGSHRVLQGLFPVSPRISELADSVQSVYSDYREAGFLRQPLQQSFTLTLSLVLLLTLLFAIWTAFYFARRLAAPIRDLAEGTRAVAAGDYGTQLPPAGRDELGFLVQSFNDMSRRVAQTRQAAKRSQAQVERQRAYLETVLARLSSGVITLDNEGRIRTSNQAAAEILGVPLGNGAGEPLSDWMQNYPHLSAFAASIDDYLRSRARDWRGEFNLEGESGRSIVICTGAGLPGTQSSGGHVLVLDDVTTLIQAQRDAAWGEVARRLAHEIKNPLTPIQLSAERLRHKYLVRMEGRDAEVFERATNTIVQQVDAMKEMVNAFSEYARPPRLRHQELNLNQLIREVVELYRSAPQRPDFELQLDPELPPLVGDSGRLRQLLHNLITNALEAAGDSAACRITLSTTRPDDRLGDWLELVVADNGPGVAETILEQVFEPYTTTKPKGTGLGLAIVKKIVEEHNGVIAVRNTNEGARIVVRIPIPTPAKR